MTTARLSSQCIGIGTMLLLSMNAAAFAPKHPPSTKSSASLPQLKDHVVRPDQASVKVPKSMKSLQGQSITVDKNSGAIRSISGNLNIELPAEMIATGDVAGIAAICRQYTTDHPEIFPGLTGENLVLDEQAVLLNKKEQFLKFRIEMSGLRVSDALIDFRYNFGSLVQVINQSFSEATFASTKSNVDTASRLDSIGSLGKLHAQGSVYRIVSGNFGYQAIAVDVYKTTFNGEPVEVQADRRSGKVFEIKDLNHYATGRVKANIYPRWYGEALVEAPLGDITIVTGANNSTSTTDGSGLFQGQENFTATAKGLRGPKVNVAVKTGTLIERIASIVNGEQILFFDKQGTQVSHADVNVAQSMIFAHTNKIVDLAKNYITSPWLGAPLVANANLGMSCNAHWDGTTINFYSADAQCANTALISDVTYHEWGHGLDANTGGIEDGAYSEGFGDIMSLVMTRSNILGIGFLLDGRPVRDLDPDVRYPEGQGEVHAEGLIIAGTFYDLFKLLSAKLGEDAANALLRNLAFKMIVAASKYTDAYQALLVIDDNDTNLQNGTPHLCEINEAFAAHGLSTLDNRCLLGEMPELTITEVSGNQNGVIEPGEQLHLQPSLLNTTGSVLANVVGQASVTPAIAGITVVQPSLHFPEIANGERLPSSDNVELSVDGTVVCGTEFSLRFDLSNQERSAKIIKNLLVGKLIGTAGNYALAETLPKPIPDVSRLETNFNVAGQAWDSGVTIQSAFLEFGITHTYIGDLRISLKSPAGAVIEIYKGSGSADNVAFSADVSNLLRGKVGAGGWKFVVEDSASQDVGTLDSFKLTMVPAKFECK